MPNDATKEQVLVLSDDSGSYYAIPVDALEGYRVTDEQKAEIERLIGPEVSGYGMFEQYITESRASQYQAERQGEAKRERSLKSSRESESGEDKPVPRRGFFTGVVTTLQALSRRTPNEA